MNMSSRVQKMVIDELANPFTIPHISLYSGMKRTAFASLINLIVRSHVMVRIVDEGTGTPKTTTRINGITPQPMTRKVSKALNLSKIMVQPLPITRRHHSLKNTNVNTYSAQMK